MRRRLFFLAVVSDAGGLDIGAAPAAEQDRWSLALELPSVNGNGGCLTSEELITEASAIMITLPKTKGFLVDSPNTRTRPPQTGLRQ